MRLPSTLLALATLAGGAAAQTTHVVTLQSFSFDPVQLEIEVGDTVRWVWQVGLHNVESGFHGAYDGNFSSGPPQAAPNEFAVTFDQAYLDANPMEGGVYPYYCITHLFLLMYGRIVVNTPRTLEGSTTLISESSGGAQVLSLDLGSSQAGHFYWVVGSASGVSPGSTAQGFTLPLNLDTYFLFHVSNPNTLISSSIGFLDGNGRATATFATPPGLGNLAALTFHHAAMVFDPVGFDLSGVTNAWPLTFVF